MPIPVASHLRAAAVTVMVAANTVFWGVPVHLLALVKFFAWRPAWKRACAAALMRTVRRWIGGVLFVQDRFLGISWDIREEAVLDPEAWYLVTCNHRTWADIPVLLKVLTDRVPFPKIFAKRQMLWVPIIGSSLWALDYPIMKRYSRSYLKRHPGKRGMDLETTRQACRRYHFTPVTILNFPEGTRFSPSKQRRQKAPFRHLLRPKAGGLAFALEAMEGRISRMLDVTIVYPGGDSRFWSFLAGEVARVTVHIRDIRIPAGLQRGGYADDARCREAFQQWIRSVWQEKDALIERFLAENAAAPGEDRPGQDRG